MAPEPWIPKLRAAPHLGPAIEVCLVVILAYLVVSYLRSPLKKYPGPFLAKFTNLWRMYRISRRAYHKDLEKLHKKYGPVVQIAPNVIDVDYPELIKTVFNVKGDWKKTEFYLSSSALVNGQIVLNLFSELDVVKHAQTKRPIAKHYSPSGVAAFEPHMDRTIQRLCDELETRFMSTNKSGGASSEKEKPVVDLGEWILYYTWDVVGETTFSQPLGYLSAGHDFDGTLRNADKAMDYFSWVGCIPILDRLLDKNPVVHLGPPGFGGIMALSVKRLIDRAQGKDKEFHDSSRPDYLDKFIEAKTANPDTVDDFQLVSWLMINMIAGADTTAITLRSAIYFSLWDKRIWTRLQTELAAAGLTRDKCPLPYKETRAIPYLEAIVREALRILPAVSGCLERYVPSGGQRLPDGSFVPENCVVAFNPYVLGRNREVFGSDADEFKPERWLQSDKESDDAFQTRLRAMNNADLSFGGGSRMCLGRHMGLMQVYKVVSTLAVRYDAELAHPEKEWTVFNSFFPRQEGLEVRISKRN
ncbi:cytochrome P450 [Apodospora peruviana]|uniref:Cytochrome P450 n=1 Tax=Apodospora peruviana TaxID=516989 RepID=A0AAE0M8A7_9PEZI|nr:cytochrome P450 [Apodospora peruviana]